MKKAVSTAKAPAAIGPYSQGVAAGGWVFVSGQIPLGTDGKPVEGGIEAQTERCILNIAAVLEAEGLDLADVVKTTVYMTDLSLFPIMNEMYGKHFEAPYPARATVQVVALPKGVSVEIEAIAASGA